MLKLGIFSILVVWIYCIQGAFSQQQCRPLTVRTYVEYNCTLQRNRNSRCTFGCEPGYRLRSRSATLRTCRCFPNLCIWTGPVATCIPSPTTPRPSTTAAITTPVRSESRLSSDCPSPDMGQHSLQAVDTWPTGGVFRVEITKPNMSMDAGWSVVVKFNRSLPSNVTVMSWNSEVTPIGGKYLGLSNMEHNSDLTEMDSFSFTIVILGATMQDMDQYSALVGFYRERIENTTCFTLMDSEESQSSSTVKPLEATTPAAPAISVTTPESTTSTRTTPRSTTIATTPAATTPAATTPAATTPAATTPAATTPAATTPAATTPAATTPAATQPTAAGSNIDNVRINHSVVRRLRSRCNILQNSMRVENPSYPAPGSSSVFRFNADVSIRGAVNYIRDWTLKIVFSKQINSIQVWTAKFDRKSSDGHVYILRPQPWNSQLRNDLTIQVIPEMRSRSIPQAVMYLCPSGVRPDLRHVGIFQRIPGSNNAGNSNSQRPSIRPTRTIAQTRRITTPRPRPTPATTRRPSRNPRCTSPAGRLPTRYGQTRVSYTRSPPNERSPYDYNEVLAMSILFYEAQRSGKLPSNNRIPWRGDSGLRDGCDVGHDLTGGWYDAGDHVKFGLPMAWSVTTLAWGVIEFREAYVEAGEFTNVLNSLKWVTDYFIKAHTAKYELYGQVGNGHEDHGSWGRPEEMSMARPSYKITSRKPGTELAAETAAALAACSVIFRDVDRSYADLLVRHAKELYEFAYKYKGSYHKYIPNVSGFYRSYSGYRDELVWGALWLYRATNQRIYLTNATREYRLSGGGGTPKFFSWDNKIAGSQVLMANFTGQSQYRNHVAAYQRFLSNAPKTPRGLTWLDRWGSNRYAANGAFIALAASKVTGMANKQSYIRYATSQIHYMLGDAGRSYVVGYGNNPPRKPHHRSSSCSAPPARCDWGNGFHGNGNNPNILYGALIAGPKLDGSFTNNRTNYVSNEVATDYNAGFQGALAGLKYFQIKARRN